MKSVYEQCFFEVFGFDAEYNDDVQIEEFWNLCVHECMRKFEQYEGDDLYYKIQDLKI